MKKKSPFNKVTVLVICLFAAQLSCRAQGCETILLNGVFNTFSSTYGSYSSNEWHQYWCNGTVKQVTQGSETSVALDVVVKAIPIGLSFDDAKRFQSIYRQINCGANSGNSINLSSDVVIQKIASPEILDAYIKCKRIENDGLQVNLNIRPDDRKVFVIDVKYTKAWGTPQGPRVKKVSFVPNVIAVKEGSLQDNINLEIGKTYSLICERSTDIPLTVMIETEVGVFITNLPAFIPPPTDQEKIMAALPRGTILGWFNSGNVPKGWVICDGKNGTPDFVGRSPIGTNGNAYPLGGSVGQQDHIHTMSGTTGVEKKSGIRTGAGMQSAGNECEFHTHTVNIESTRSSNIPPSTYIIFIMKI